MLLLVAALAAGDAFAGDRSRAEEELERQLRELVSIPAPRVIVSFEALEEPGMKLESVEFMLDGRALSGPSAATLSKPGRHQIFAGEVAEGRHELITRLTYVDDSPVLLSSQAGFKWKIARHVRFETRDGLELTVRAVPERLSGESDPRKQLVIRYEQDVKMLAQVDTSMPPPPKKKEVAAAVAAEPADAGVAEAEPVTPVVEAEPADEEDEDAAPRGQVSKQKSKKKKPARTRTARGVTQPTSGTREADEPTWDRRSVKLAEVEAAETEESEVVAAAALDAVPTEDAGVAEVRDETAEAAAVAGATAAQPSPPEKPQTADATSAYAKMPVPMPMVVGAIVVLLVAGAVLWVRWRRRTS